MDNSTQEIERQQMTHEWDEIFLKNDNLWIYSGTVLIPLGTIGHLLSIAVVLSSRSLRTQSSGVFIIALSVTGILAIYTGLLRYTIKGYSHDSIDIRDGSLMVCQLHTMLTYTSLQFIAWMQATISIDRLVHVALPVWRPQCHLYSTRIRWKQGIVIVCVEVVIAAALNSCSAFVAGISISGFCTTTNEKLGKIWRYVDLLSFSLIPAAIIITANSLILFTVFRHRVRSEKCDNKLGNNKLSKRRQSLTRMLCAVNICFLLTTLPISSLLLVDEWYTQDRLQKARMYLINAICNLLQYIGVASTFLMYCVSGSKFRLQLRRMFWKKTFGSIRSRSTDSKHSTKEVAT